MRAKLAEAALKEGRETRAEPTSGGARLRRRRAAPAEPAAPGPTPEEINSNEIRAEADQILESGAHFRWSSKESSDEELDEKRKNGKLTVKEGSNAEAGCGHAWGAAEEGGGWVVAAYRKYLASKGRRPSGRVPDPNLSGQQGQGNHKPDESGAKFPPSLMDQQAFLVLEQWALHYKITQGEMYKVYEAYYDNLHAKKHPDGAHKVPNRISTYYFQDLFDHQTSEATSLILIPLLCQGAARVKESQRRRLYYVPAVSDCRVRVRAAILVA